MTKLEDSPEWASVQKWIQSVVDTVHQCSVDLLLYGNAFRIEAAYPEHWRRLDPGRVTIERVKIGRKWHFTPHHPDAVGQKVRWEKLTE